MTVRARTQVSTRPGAAGLGLVGLGLVGLGLVALAVGLVLALTPGTSTVAGAVPTVDVGVLPTRPEAPVTRPASVPAPAASLADDTRLRVSRLDLDARVVRVRLVGSVLDVPRDPARVGWWTGGAVPGARQGSAVLVGHVDYDGVTGAFATLPRMRPGDLLSLTRPARRFRVDAVRTYAKSAGLPPDLFALGGPPRLILITCGGPFDPHDGHYVDNIVVYARPA